jgi:hypothetical protein
MIKSTFDGENVDALGYVFAVSAFLVLAVMTTVFGGTSP